ncbi:ATP-binding protein [Rubritalea tangerina]|uniref:ATP-binding protein n=1 Tax=Rubritalea tangerina TaxID=430798 RepID=A0ABW4ZC83_9BACT
MLKAQNNPFRTSRQRDLLPYDPTLHGDSWQQIFQRWKSLGQHVSISAPHGAGKTTFLDAFETYLNAKGFPTLRITLHTHSPKISRQTFQHIKANLHATIILDGEEQLNPFQKIKFRRISKSAVGSILTNHHTHPHPSLLTLTPSLPLLEHCVSTLAPEHFSTLKPYLPHWFQQHQQNIRHVLLECYDFLSSTD